VTWPALETGCNVNKQIVVCTILIIDNAYKVETITLPQNLTTPHLIE